MICFLLIFILWHRAFEYLLGDGSHTFHYVGLSGLLTTEKATSILVLSLLGLSLSFLEIELENEPAASSVLMAECQFATHHLGKAFAGVQSQSI